MEFLHRLRACDEIRLRLGHQKPVHVLSTCFELRSSNLGVRVEIRQEIRDLPQNFRRLKVKSSPFDPLLSGFDLIPPQTDA